MSEVPRDSAGRLVTIHGLVLDSANPARTLRELLRQWVVLADADDWQTGSDLMRRTQAALEAVDIEGRMT